MRFAYLPSRARAYSVYGVGLSTDLPLTLPQAATDGRCIELSVVGPEAFRRAHELLVEDPLDWI